MKILGHRFFDKAKDGGPKSTVTGYWLAEIKSLFSVVLLRFDDGSRDDYHSHAFDSINWVLKGQVEEQHLDGRKITHTPGLAPVVTAKTTFHRVVSQGTTWVFSIRGPWSKTWQEFTSNATGPWLSGGRFTTLGHGREVQS